MLASRSLFRLDRVLKFTTTYAALEPVNYFLGHRGYCGLRYNIKMGGGKDKQSGGDRNKKIRTTNAVWRPVSTQATSNEECSVRVTTDELESDTRVQEVHRCTSTRISSAHNVIEVGASLVRFIRGKGGSTQREIEDEMGVKIIIPSSKEEDSVIIEGISMESISRASEKIHTIIDEAVKSQNLDYSHFISLPLAIHPELVDKLVNFQNSILGISDSCVDEKLNSDSNEDTSENEGEDQKLEKGTDVAVELNVEGDSEQVKVNLTNIPLVSYAPKMSRASTLSDLGIEKSIFIKPKTFHLTVLMLKLWNKDRVHAAIEVLQSVSSKVIDALDNRPISIRLQGLNCMRGSLAKAGVVYAPVEEIGSQGRLLRACQVITDAYTKAGLVLEKDANQKLKLHATVMNARHRKRKNQTRKVQSFDAHGIFKQYGSEEWGEYLIREAHLSQRFVFDDNGYYHCCASIPFPETYE
ncbi:A-kinase anchor protein 7-like isoform X4 [Prunus avium]|uniref:A-kinase anchor protein 7-like isoform X4 n=1 Tax=Prunus avium TaxID=42229 RepID=A0A6P5R943_PRUAV|nr:A-kinase anchor protein 7-like isoform X4 [Prunus avium]